ncbi:unnamed protein product [Acanthocheilonema viteae]|uniref:Uncharacterized protein n=1 Tax=Acanthocheilonema viteae TaxID=6277 RepID=A0A498S4T9_ACAVI|nr:unnamed protein product [Acanthocheilonema viteae]
MWSNRTVYPGHSWLYALSTSFCTNIQHTNGMQNFLTQMPPDNCCMINQSRFYVKMMHSATHLANAYVLAGMALVSTDQLDGGVTPGLVNNQCYNDADCSQHFHCVNRNGIRTCQTISEMLQYKTCQSDADCDIAQICSFSKQYNTNLCVTTPEYRTIKMVPSWNVNIGGGVIPSSLIGKGAISKKFEVQCTADYQLQCSVFETCAKKSISADRICIYNPTASNRQCRFNADCQSGQRCEKVLESLYFCRAAKQTTFMQPCTYDYECSGDQRCINVNISNVAFFQQVFGSTWVSCTSLGWELIVLSNELGLIRYSGLGLECLFQTMLTLIQ